MGLTSIFCSCEKGPSSLLVVSVCTNSPEGTENQTVIITKLCRVFVEQIQENKERRAGINVFKQN